MYLIIIANGRQAEVAGREQIFANLKRTGDFTNCGGVVRGVGKKEGHVLRSLSCINTHST